MEAVKLFFSRDSWSQLFAVFSNGTAKVYSMKARSNEVALGCSYVDKTKNCALDMIEVFSLNSNHMLTDQDMHIKNPSLELSITNGLFHPSFDLFGIQKSVVVATNSNFSNKS